MRLYNENIIYEIAQNVEENYDDLIEIDKILEECQFVKKNIDNGMTSNEAKKFSLSLMMYLIFLIST